MRTPRWQTVAVAVLAALIAACTGNAADPDAAEESAPLDLAEAPDPATILPDDPGEAPEGLVAEDLVVGEGDAATEGDRLTLQYVGVRFADGGTFDSSWERGQPFQFQLGAGQVIEGWDRGVAGDDLDLEAMRVGGRRILTIPPDLAYGVRGAGEMIGPDETLVFVVDLLEISPGQSTQDVQDSVDAQDADEDDAAETGNGTDDEVAN